jgi:hydroxymethylpyrimidine pyrophosphatase-like HAD family hydrolase
VIDTADVLALGDAEADIGMLRLAGVGVALGNAHALVKAAADWVAPDAADAGVAAAVRRFVLEA